MALQFRPPDDLVRDYLNRPSPGQEASAGIQQALQQYAQNKKEEENKKYQQQALTSLDAQRKATEFKAMADYLPEKQVAGVGRAYGLPFPAQTPDPTEQPPNTGYTPQGQPMSLAQPAQQAPQISDVVLAHIQETGHNPMDHDIPTSKAGLAKYKTGLETKKLEKELNAPPKGPLKTLTKEEALANGEFDPTKELMVEPPDRSAKDQKYTNEQDRLEAQAIDRLSKLRGDQSLARTENQRDAAIQAFNTIDRVKKEGRMPSQLEYYDILGQMWKARTGASPTDQALRDLDAKTFKGDLGKAFQYFSGKPAGVTTGDVLQNIQDFAADSGLQSDKFHSSYMDSHKLKPSGLEQSRWDPILNSHRGTSFVEATGYKPREIAAAHQAYADPGKEERYQAWKAKQGR